MAGSDQTWERDVQGGTTAIELSPSGFVERLSVIIPPPRAKPIIYRGVLAASLCGGQLVLRCMVVGQAVFTSWPGSSAPRGRGAGAAGCGCRGRRRGEEERQARPDSGRGEAVEALRVGSERVVADRREAFMLPIPGYG